MKSYCRRKKISEILTWDNDELSDGSVFLIVVLSLSVAVIEAAVIETLSAAVIEVAVVGTAAVTVVLITLTVA